MTTTTKKEEEEFEGRKEERSLLKVKKTELYSSLDATTIEIFFTEEDVVMEKEEVSHRFIFDSEGSRVFCSWKHTSRILSPIFVKSYFCKFARQ
jgi:hypothetical protein